MNLLNKTAAAILLLLGSVAHSCEKDEALQVDSFLQSLDSAEYYQQEFLTENYRYIYGIWDLFEVSGGIHGQGYDPGFDYLEIKQYGIYGLVREDRVFEYGKIELVPQFTGETFMITLKFTAEHTTGINPYFSSPFHIQMSENPRDTLDMNTAFPDSYSYHFQRMK